MMHVTLTDLQASVMDTSKIPIPGYPGYEMSYELDLVFSEPTHAIVARNDPNEQESVVAYDPGTDG